MKVITLFKVHNNIFDSLIILDSKNSNYDDQFLNSYNNADKLIIQWHKFEAP